MPKSHKLASLSAVPLSALAGEPILLPRATMNAGNIFADAMRRAGYEAKYSYRANYPELIKALVKRGLGVAPMPRMLVSDSLEGLAIIPFEKPLYRDLDIIYPRDRPLPTGARALMVHMRAAVTSRGTSDQA